MRFDRCLGNWPLPSRIYVHGRGIVHRDLKPSNIVLTRDGGIKLLDFGIVTVEENSDLWNTLKTTSHPRMIGTPRYMAPEQFSGRVTDRRVDYYGVASVVFEVLTGRPVIAATDVFDIIRELAQFVLPAREDIGQGISQEMYDVLLRGLEHDPDKRSLDCERLALWAAPLHLDSQARPISHPSFLQRQKVIGPQLENNTL